MDAPAGDLTRAYDTAVENAHRLEAERDRYRETLEDIAGWSASPDELRRWARTVLNQEEL